MNKKSNILIFVAICALVIIALQITLVLIKKEIFSYFDWYGRAIVALLITLVLSLATKSYAKVTGTYLSYHFQIGGAIVIFCLILASSYFKEIFLEEKEFSFAVQVKNYNDEMMPKDMSLYFLSGTYESSATINSDGIANFINIKKSLLNDSVRLQLRNGNGYEIINGDNKTVITANKNIEIKLQRPNFLKGTVLNNGQVVEHASVYLVDIDTTIYTSKNGSFTFRVQDINLKPTYSLTIKKDRLKIDEHVTINTPSEFDLKNP